LAHHPVTSRPPPLTYRKREKTSVIILHDSHTVPGKANLEWWLKVNGRKLGLLEIGYHAVIFQDGRLLETRPHDTQGSHTRGFNSESIGVCLAGGRRIIPGDDGEEIEVPADNFTEAQRATLKWYLEYLTPAYGSLSLKAHSELGMHKHRHIHCPALNMEKLREWLTSN